MNIHNIFYNSIRIISIVSILALLSIGFILPISYVQALVINPIILVSLMVIFAVSNEKLKSVTQVADIVRLPSNSKCKLCAVSKAA
jgi:hypothetical protein